MNIQAYNLQGKEIQGIQKREDRKAPPPSSDHVPIETKRWASDVLTSPRYPPNPEDMGRQIKESVGSILLCF